MRRFIHDVSLLLHVGLACSYMFFPSFLYPFFCLMILCQAWNDLQKIYNISGFDLVLIPFLCEMDSQKVKERKKLHTYKFAEGEGHLYGRFYCFLSRHICMQS
ncbi:unnamed protein product [Ilex paraguariensis]|uniref:Uncharacterized protein n=1 Tax=Ilex paraguariensis TaxID=185542 RepID=A0ABC8TPK4_9AQUA